MFVASLLLITHITGLVASTLMIIFNTLFIIYTLKFKKRLKDNYKKQYDQIGKQNKKKL